MLLYIYFGKSTSITSIKYKYYKSITKLELSIKTLNVRILHRNLYHTNNVHIFPSTFLKAYKVPAQKINFTVEFITLSMHTV